MSAADQPSDPDRASFAAKIAELIREAGEKGEIHFDADQFQLKVDGERSNIANLTNLYGEYLRAGTAERERLIRNFVRSWFAPLKGLPEDYDDLHPDLLPSVRPRAYIESNLTRMRLQGIKDPGWPYCPLAHHMAICLVYDLPESLMQIQQHHLDDWKTSFDRALEDATANLFQISQHPFEEIAPGLWRSPWQDNLDASRLVLPDLLRLHEVQGDLIAIVPNRDMLLLTGSEDEQGLVQMAELATEAFDHARAISGFALRLDSLNRWEPWVPDPGHPAFAAFRLLAVRSLGGDYSDQKELLEQQHHHEGEDIFVASFSGMRDKQSGEVFSYCVWSEGVDTLLPRTDSIVFFSGDEDTGEVLGSVAWERAVEVVGELMTDQDVYPERYRVQSFPTPEQLDELLGAE
jgi:hypothetical protein